MHLELTVLNASVGLNSMCTVGHDRVLKQSFWYASKNYMRLHVFILYQTCKQAKKILIQENEVTRKELDL